jgi:hypothetical protein
MEQYKDVNELRSALIKVLDTQKLDSLSVYEIMGCLDMVFHLFKSGVLSGIMRGGEGVQ